MKEWCAVCGFLNVTETTSDPLNAVPTLHSPTTASTNPTTTDHTPARAFPSRKAFAGDGTEGLWITGRSERQWDRRVDGERYFPGKTLRDRRSCST